MQSQFGVNYTNLPLQFNRCW